MRKNNLGRGWAHYLTILIRVIVIFAIGFAIGTLGARLLKAQAALPAYETTECPFNAADNVECGFVTVPETRANPDSPTIRIATVILRGDDSDVPALLLSGGPGEITTPNAGFSGAVFQQVAGGRTLIMFDQRGVGRSEPALECPNWIEAQLNALAPEVTPEEALIANNTALIECANNLEAQGINLDAYNSLENAADVRDIVAALGYEQVNLIGVSYGSLLAQHVMRDYPEVVRAAVIDSVLPLEESFLVNSTDTAFRAIDRVLDACAADSVCAQAYPDLESTLRSTVAQYNENPTRFTVTDPTTGIEYPSLLTGDAIIGAVLYYLYRTPDIPVLPQAITEIANGNTAIAESLTSQFLGAYYAIERGMQFSVQCAEDLLLTSEADLRARYEALPPEFRGRVDLDVIMQNSLIDLCEAFPVETLDVSVKSPLVTDIPVLALGGEFDPVTPPDYAERVTANLPNAYTYIFPGVGHSVALASQCAVGIIVQFLNDPAAEPDASCIDGMGITFRVPDMELALEPFTNDTFGISGVIPAGWQEIAPGIYAQSAASSVAIIQQSAPVSADELLALLTQQLGIDGFPEVSNTLNANGRMWSLYETSAQGSLLVDVAVAEGDGATSLIVLLSTSIDRETYYQGAFLPAIEAYAAQ